ncbi:hypothetical protein ACUXZZ_44900 [Streptomyces graminifolii]|uniref:hypothetical protein n=1 Tax=Streptomyces graminifolii TaxID=1266771 RepID=UPI004059BB0F
MRHAARRKPGRFSTTFKTAAVSAITLGSLVLVAETANAAVSPSHSTVDNDAVRVQKEKAVAAQSEGSTVDNDAVRVQKQKLVAAQSKGSTASSDTIRVQKQKAAAALHATQR